MLGLEIRNINSKNHDNWTKRLDIIVRETDTHPDKMPNAQLKTETPSHKRVVIALILYHFIASYRVRVSINYA